MPRYAAFLRGVSPMNAKMPQLKAAFEAAGFEDVRTVRSSGNVVFSAKRAAADASLERRAEAAMQKHLGRHFITIVRPIETLRAMLASDPYAPFGLSPREKRVITFVRDGKSAKLKLPIEVEGTRILRIDDGQIFSAYVPNPKEAVFMTVIEKTFGKEVTTRTWETVAMVAR